MSALKISLEQGKIASSKYALGVAIVTIPQVIISVILTKYITTNPTILESLEKIGILIFIVLAYYFYKASKKEKLTTSTSKKKKPLLTGVTIAVLNMFSIPFFCGILFFLEALNQFNFKIIPFISFAIGAVFGTFYILYLYGKFAKHIQKKTGKLTKNINLILAIITGFVAVFTLLKQTI